MVNPLAELVALPDEDLLSRAREVLRTQAARIYAPEALKVVERIFLTTTSFMPREQLAYIVRRGGR